ncbi:MAG: ArnT family glycosyltransferase [Bryobacteraceae bacterium]
MSAIAVAAMLCGFTLMLWAQNEFSSPESIVAAQSTMLTRDGTLYYDLNHYPYTVCAYMPLFYGLQSGFTQLGLPAFAAGRLISFTALLSILVLCWRILMLYTGNRYCAWTGTLLGASSSLLLNWGTTAQVDTLALSFAIAAFYQFSRWAIRAERRLVWAAILAILAFFTKQTMLACPVALFVLLYVRDRRLALRFAAATGAVVLVLVLGINTALDGRFLADTFWANLNPFAMKKINQHVLYLLIAAGQLLLITAAGASRLWRGRGRELLVYLGLAASVLAVTAPKVGSDSNYQLETTVLLILSAGMALHSLDFFPRCFRGSKTWITLLQLPLAVHLILNVRIARNILLDRIAREQQFRQQVATLRPFLADGGRVLSTEGNALVRIRGGMEVEPLIYGLLVGAGRIDPEPLRRDLAAEAFSTIILLEDLARPLEPDPEIATLPQAQRAEIQKHYRLVTHIPGPYLGGIYVYKSAGKLAL